MTTRFFGARVQRVEDGALVTGAGRFTDDIKLKETLSAAFVRSPFAHARIVSIDASAAKEMPGVHLVLTAADLPAAWRDKRLPLDVPAPAIRHPLTQFPLAADEVCFCGEAVAVVVADNRALAEDAAEQVMVEYDPLPAVVDCRTALAPDGPLAQTSVADNLAAKWVNEYGDIERAFAGAAHVIAEDYFQHRGTGCPLEPRAVLAQYDRAGDSLTVWSATQAPHGIKRAIVDMFDIADTQVRVIAPDVGGGFGPKLLTYPEEIVIPHCARLIGRPVKWIEDRREHMMSTAQERDQLWSVRMALDADGRILGLRGTLLHDTGAFLPWGIIMPYISATTFPGPYVVPAYRLDTSVVFTNKISTSPMRGAGRPQAVFAVERLLDRAAQVLGLDRAEIRRRNLIPAEAMPYKVGLIYRDGQPLTYDSGDYPQCQQMALDTADWAGFEARRAKARAEGRHLGIGLANYVEGTGLGPFEGATARLLPSGRILLRTGAASQGQGHRTVLAQIAADAFGVAVDEVDVEVGDTASVSVGVGAFASRLMVNAGSAVDTSSQTLALKLRQIAAAVLDAELDDIELSGGVARVMGTQGGQISFREIAKMSSGRPGFSLPRGIEPGLEATSFFAPPQAAYSNGSHVAEVEVDPETGLVKVTRYVVAHDCGRVINPLLVDGQIQGGVAHGIGNAIMERMRYDEAGNPQTTSLADYLLPDAGNVPNVEIVHMESPSPLNPLGVKGAGEGGTIPAAAAIASAIEDALSPFGVKILDAPMLPETIAMLVKNAQAQKDAR
ncbi:xanthine dehydrogenase family protein molybdopterin-binding subunit [Xanthobacter tagetidis]|uniref:Dehydrogenase n=1 Tax=Xanthobacter tagetidis TaxID=60216 RepID=A0A3L7AG31_9HYPH|nr:xanthine dehydrogenase family protein molybdopterin-binding subunit [Xanthobacter tagetidis]MBB6305838.1 carbon-monoxide dehydrogenase large subunit [Xanthobacter tagetidis]RLP78362.1 dehydrogenase [Xanthobacter tagetidis]